MMNPARMKTIITIPIELYRTLESRCASRQPFYRLLKSGVISENRSQVVIRCDAEHALRLCAWANNRADGAARQISLISDSTET